MTSYQSIPWSTKTWCYLNYLELYNHPHPTPPPHFFIFLFPPQIEKGGERKGDIIVGLSNKMDNKFPESKQYLIIEKLCA